MKRNSEYIMSKIIDKEGLAKPAQIGVDLTVSYIEAITENSYMPLDGKIKLGEYSRYLEDEDEDGNIIWELGPGAYAVEFHQGLKKLSPTENAYIIQRSSLNRAGIRVEGSIFDPGFETDNLGATMYVWAPITITRGARIAQITIEENEPVNSEALYSGRWQGKSNVE